MKASNSVILQIGDCYIVQKGDGSFVVASHPQRYVVLSGDRLKDEIENLIGRVINGNDGISTYKEGRNDTLAFVREIIGDCPDCSHEQMILVIRKLNSLK